MRRRISDSQGGGVEQREKSSVDQVGNLSANCATLGKCKRQKRESATDVPEMLIDSPFLSMETRADCYGLLASAEAAPDIHH